MWKVITFFSSGCTETFSSCRTEWCKSHDDNVQYGEVICVFWETKSASMDVGIYAPCLQERSPIHRCVFSMHFHVQYSLMWKAAHFIRHQDCASLAYTAYMPLWHSFALPSKLLDTGVLLLGACWKRETAPSNTASSDKRNHTLTNARRTHNAVQPVQNTMP